MRSYTVIETRPACIDPMDGPTHTTTVEHVVVRASSSNHAVEQVRDQLDRDGLLRSRTTFTVKTR